MPLLPSTTEQQRWLALARASILQHWHPDEHGPEALEWGERLLNLFVTLHDEQGQLRGCIGTTDNTRQPLAELLPHLARQAAFEDPRFSPLSEAQLNRCRISLTLLGDPTPVAAKSPVELCQKLDPELGLILSYQGRRALFLPAVWQQLPERSAFLAALLRKGGWHQWLPGMQAWQFPATEFEEN
ncbi:AmmeMemoRadiSam system protein A [Ferrimonas gelatinilytica]|uniref:AMMECR1 domain-containing protein n=1 Tax=Ferrimonas gelatinilytica TaxID=1255257 RepID=A0ABP9S3M7_9GAMM